MENADHFKVVRSQREPLPEIILAGPDGNRLDPIDAARLIGQYRLGPAVFLLVLDEDCSFEEQLHLVLVRDSRESDHIVIGAPYASGIFEPVDHAGEALRFRFANDGIWTASFRDEGTLLPPRLPRGASRKGGWLGRHHLALSYEEDRR